MLNLFCFNYSGDKLSDAEAFAGGLLNRFLQIVQFNAHEVSEFMMTGKKTLEGAKNRTLGAAIYPTLALFNHSCNTALNRYLISLIFASFIKLFCK